MIRTLSCTTHVIVNDETALREHAVTLRGERARSTTLATAVLAAVINPAEPPEECGFRILSSTNATRVASMRANPKFRIQVDVEITCPDKLLMAAVGRYQACWGDHEWVPLYPADALFEILIASNANPIPSDIGLALVGAANDRRARAANEMTDDWRGCTALSAQ